MIRAYDKTYLEDAMLNLAVALAPLHVPEASMSFMTGCLPEM